MYSCVMCTRRPAFVCKVQPVKLTPCRRRQRSPAFLCLLCKPCMLQIWESNDRERAAWWWVSESCLLTLHTVWLAGRGRSNACDKCVLSNTTMERFLVFVHERGCGQTMDSLPSVCRMCGDCYGYKVRRDPDIWGESVTYACLECLLRMILADWSINCTGEPAFNYVYTASGALRYGEPPLIEWLLEEWIKYIIASLFG
jgi:hypothetical protein